MTMTRFLLGSLALLAYIIVASIVANAAPLTNAQTYGAQHTDAFRNGTPGMIMVKGTTDNNSYMLEADPVTGAIPVSASITFPYDTNYGTVGALTLRTAAQIGNATGAASFGAGTTGAQTLRVVLPTDQTAIPVSQSGTWTVTQNGRAYADSVRNVYNSTNVTTGAWVQLIASTAAAINWLTIFDSSGQTLELGTGGAGVESRVLIIPPGGVTQVPLRIAAGTRVSIRAVSGTASTGEIDLSALN